jgi:hypothetical protein
LNPAPIQADRDEQPLAGARSCALAWSATPILMVVAPS